MMYSSTSSHHIIEQMKASFLSESSIDLYEELELRASSAFGRAIVTNNYFEPRS